MLLDGDLDLQTVIFIIVSLVIGFSVHEFSHAAVAHVLGDSTPKDQGRLTLSPIVHLDIVGTLMFLFAGFGWAKPVEINPNSFKSPVRDDLLVSFAGPASNFILAFIVAKLYFFNIPESYDGLLTIMIWTNVVLAVFNLLPIPPLDGSRIIPVILPPGMRSTWEHFEQYSIVLFLVLVFSGVTDLIMDYPVEILYELAYLGLPL